MAGTMTLPNYSRLRMSNAVRMRFDYRAYLRLGSQVSSVDCLTFALWKANYYPAELLQKW